MIKIGKLLKNITEFSFGDAKVKIGEKVKSEIEEIVEYKQLKLSNISEELKKTIYQTSDDEVIQKSKIKNCTLLAFAAGGTLDKNLEYNIYFDPVDINHNTSFKHIGLYANKKEFVQLENRKRLFIVIIIMVILFLHMIETILLD